MDPKPMGGFLKRLFGSPNPTVVDQTPVATVPPIDALAPQKTKAVPSLPTTEAYLNRKKGRKLHHESYADVQRLYETIKAQGEAKPGDLAKELGMARSSLAYALNRLVKRRYVERLGGGRSIRYRVTGVSLGRIT